MPSTTCPECAGRMTRGFMADRAHMGIVVPSDWVEGEPEAMVWSGARTRTRTHYPVTTYRCERCGFLKFYARDGEDREEGPTGRAGRDPGAESPPGTESGL